MVGKKSKSFLEELKKVYVKRDEIKRISNIGREVTPLQVFRAINSNVNTFDENLVDSYFPQEEDIKEKGD